MYVIRVVVQAKPDSVDALVDQLSDESREVPERFAGCERFDVAVDVADDHRVVLVEEWADETSFRAYRDSDYFAQAGSVLMPLVDGPPDSAYYQATRVGP